MTNETKGSLINEIKRLHREACGENGRPLAEGIVQDKQKKAHQLELLTAIKQALKGGASLEHDGNNWVIADHAGHESFKDFAGSHDDLLRHIATDHPTTKYYFDNTLPDSGRTDEDDNLELDL